MLLVCQMQVTLWTFDLSANFIVVVVVAVTFGLQESRLFFI